MKNLISFLTIFLITVGLRAQYDATIGANLTSDDVKHFINHYPALVKEFEKLEVDFNQKSQTYQFMEAQDQMDKITKILNANGYNNVEEFALKAAGIALSYASVRMKEELTAQAPEIERAIREIENNPDLTPEQKEQTITQLKSAMAMVDSGNALAHEKDIKTVEPFVEELTQIFENQD